MSILIYTLISHNVSQSSLLTGKKVSVVKIGNKFVGKGHPCFVVAEIGINHNGSLDIAKQLIDIAIDAGCDAVKFQKRTVELVYSKDELAKKRFVDPSIIKNAMRRRVIEDIEYPVLPLESLGRLRGDINNTTNGDLKYALEFGMKEYDLIDSYCHNRGILWFASCWDGLSAHFINGFNVPCHKVASACLTHADLLRRVRYNTDHNKSSVILSTGGSTMEQIKKAVDILGTHDLVILHCTASYPCKDEEINLQVIETLGSKFPGVPIEIGILPSLIAVVAHGACMVERHITLDRNMPGSDHKASLESHELKMLVKRIRAIESGQAENLGDVSIFEGSGIKKVLPSEVPLMQKLRRVDSLFKG